MKHDFASLNDRRWRAMTNDKNAVPVSASGHLSCAEGAVICHRAPLAFHTVKVVRQRMDN
ncbi:MAG: hypothetical protein Q4G71_00725 [Pseudomonadota bacterium]|nr:hypothetical protein [Pseudomonadota bacterium]